MAARTFCLLLALGSVTSAACTGSENQVFTRLKGPVQLPVAGQGADAGPAADGGGEPLDGDDSGVVVVPLYRDPDAQFVWTETPLGHADACEPGAYTGSFSCTFDEPGDHTMLLGSIDATLGSATASKTLEVDSGRIRGFVNGTAPAFSSALEGQVSCSDASFEAGSKSSVLLVLSNDGQLDAMTVDVKLTGDFDAEALVLEGDVLLTTSEGWKCTGSFRAQLAR
jgi:hypothetical protein